MTAQCIILHLEKRLERQENLHAEASLALDVHEERVRGLHETLLLVLELLELSRGVEQVDIVLEHLRKESIA